MEDLATHFPYAKAMFAVIYRWRVKPGLEAQFEEGWHRGTLAIRRELGGWGSRLHRADDGTFIAYAIWPDEETWAKAAAKRMRYNDPEARKMYLDALDGDIETIARMHVIDDLLLGPIV
jgi:heme-degrading monooxygenase HmoA